MNTQARPHKRLEAWKHAMQLVKDVYSATAAFPTAEMFGLTAQMRRAAVSVPTNIAEGLARRTTAEKNNFLSIAKGSLSELDTQLDICKMLGYLTPEQARSLEDTELLIQRLISGLIRSLKKNNPQT